MAWQYPVSTSTGVDLGVVDSAYVLRNAIVTSAGDGINGDGDNHHVIVEGTVAGLEAIVLGHDYSTNVGESVDVRATGSVFSFDGTAITILGSSSEVRNAGVIDGGLTGVFFATYLDSGTSTFLNTGTIHGGTIGVDTTDSQAQRMDFINKGALLSEGTAFDGGSATENLTNTGRVVGDILLKDESDFYDGRSGSVKGVVSGGAGNDTIFGGKENNTILGGTGIDSIYGGAGADELTGGAQADIFLFTSVKDSTVSLKGQDTITDFAHGDLLELQSIDFNAKKGGLQHAHWIGAKDFSHVAGELRYEKAASDTYVYADTNGDGKADFAIHLDDAMKLSIHDVFL